MSKVWKPTGNQTTKARAVDLRDPDLFRVLLSTKTEFTDGFYREDRYRVRWEDAKPGDLYECWSEINYKGYLRVEERQSQPIVELEIESAVCTYDDDNEDDMEVHIGWSSLDTPSKVVDVLGKPIIGSWEEKDPIRATLRSIGMDPDKIVDTKPEVAAWQSYGDKLRTDGDCRTVVFHDGEEKTIKEYPFKDCCGAKCVSADIEVSRFTFCVEYTRVLNHVIWEKPVRIFLRPSLSDENVQKVVQLILGLKNNGFWDIPEWESRPDLRW